MNSSIGLPHHLIHILSECITKYGVNSNVLLQQLDIYIDHDHLDIPVYKITELFEIVNERDLPPGFWLEFGSKVSIHGLGLFGLWVLSAPSLATILSNIHFYSRCFWGNIDYDLVETVDSIIVKDIHYLQAEKSVLPQYLSESIAGFIVANISINCQENADKIEFHFTHSKPRLLSKYKEIIGHNMYFDSPAYSIKIPKPIMEKSLPFGNEGLHRLYGTAIEKGLREQGIKRSIADEVKTRLMAHDGKPLSIIDVAYSLGFSERSLRRYLNCLDTSFRKITNEVRSEKSLDLILNTKLSFDEISERVGFANVSNFHRAFRQWYGKSPRTARVENTDQNRVILTTIRSIPRSENHSH